MSDFDPPSVEERAKSIFEEEIWSGRLTKIFEMGPLERHALPVKPVIGPVSMNSIRTEQFGSYTRFHVIREDEEEGYVEKEFQYDGVILSDSAGNEDSVYELKRRILVHDRDLQRWYK